MNKTYIFAETVPENPVLLPPESGRMQTDRLCADIDYEFDHGDSSVKLCIDGEWFAEEDLDDLIAFAQAAKQKLIAGE